MGLSNACAAPLGEAMKALLIEKHPHPLIEKLHEARSNGHILLPTSRALVVERYSMEAQLFLEELNGAGCDPYYAQSLDEGLRTMKEKRVPVMVINVDEQEGKAWQVVERIRSEARDALMGCPYLILLSARELPFEEVRKCWKLHVVWMLREEWPAIFREVRRALCIREPQKMNSTIRFERHQGHYALYHCEGMASAHICVGFQPAKQAVILAGGRIAYSVEEIADILGVTRPTVKKYMWELREGDLLAQQQLQIVEPDRNIFWTERRPGGTILGIRANIVWD